MNRTIKTLASILAALAVWTNVLAATPQIPQTPAEWQAAASRDIDAAYQITLANHPGAQDPHNPAFVKNLQQAHDDGLALAQKVQDAAGYTAALMRFNVRIHDGHAGMASRLDASVSAPERWPGFVAVWRGDMFVYASEEGGPPAGARVLACDGKPIKQVVTENVFSFQGRIDEEGQWWSQARMVFADRGNPFITLPARCRFEADGQQFEQDLRWRARTEQAIKWRADSYNGESLQIGLTEPRKNLFWIAMPTYQPDENQRAAYRTIYREINDHRQHYLEADAVVIDLRQNQGGSSMWSNELASALWGADRVTRRKAAYFAGIETWYRVSTDNAAHFSGLLARYEREKETESMEWARDKVVRLEAALAHHDKFAVIKEDAVKPTSTADLPGDPPAFTRPVYVIVPGNCASACLDALDVFSLFPNTRLIGAPSSADSTYMEVRLQDVASGLAVVVVPTKMYVNRPRGNGVIYTPAIYVDDVKWSTAAFLQVVEKDLARP